MQTERLFYAGQPGDGYGWGVCNANLIRELGKLCVVGNGVVWGDPDIKQVPSGCEVPVFMPLADHDLNPVAPTRGPRNYGYTFFEFPLGPNAAANAAKYDTVFCGATWCKQRMEEAGITNAEVLVQGVDHSIFYPKPPREPDGKLRIFSGGKFEYRKGQDIVLAAMSLLRKRYDVELVASWFNPWPATMESMNQSPLPQELISAFRGMAGSGLEFKQDGIHLLRPLPNASMAQHMHNTDIGIFPNRCEGGTNLVLMEYLACGRPAVVSNGTGHVDVIGPNCVAVDGQTDEKGWCHVTPAAVVDGVEKARTMVLEQPDTQWTWERAARQVFNRIFKEESCLS